MSTVPATVNVNKPTDPKLRDRDIDRKLQLYGIVTAFGEGKVPSNQQIDVAMNSALQWKPLANPPKDLSQEGQHLVADLRNVIQQAKLLLLSKNEGNLIQDFTWQTRHIGQNDVSGVKAPIDQEKAKQHGNEALEGLRTLGELLITNGQFRKLLNDATVLLRDIAGDAAQKTADKVNPSEDQLNQIDQPEEDHVWHDAPDLSRENLKQQAQSRMPVGKEQAQKALGDATQAAHPSGARDPAEAANRDAQYGDTSGVDPKQGARQGAAALKEQASANMTEEQKQQMREKKERAREYFDKKMPQERRDQAIWRLKKMVVECQDHRDCKYQQAIDTLLRLAEEYQGHSKDLATQSKGTVQGGRNQGPVQNAENDLKTLLERFANGTSFDDLIDSIDQIYRDADKDPELRNWFKNMDNFVRKCLKQQGFVLEDRATEEYNQLHDQGHHLLRERYRGHTDRIANEFRFLADQFDQDAQNKAFANSMEKLFKDLGQDQDGTPQFKPHLLRDLRDVILPLIFESVGYIPIPRIEYSDNMIDAVIENLVLEGDNLMPNIVEVGSDNYWKWGRAMAKGQNRNKNTAMFSVSGIQMDIQDIAYYIKKKEGFPSVTDKGVMDIFFGGSGISFKVAMETADKSGDQHHFFKIKTVEIDIQNMDIKLKQSNHKLLFGLFKPLLIKVVKPVVQKVMEKQIRDQVTKLDGMCFEAKKEADRAVEQARRNPDPENVKSIYQQYYIAFQNQLTKAQQKTEEAKQKAANTQTNVAITQYDSIFKNISLPGGFSTQATKYKDMAKQGEKWQSPVFGLGNASGSGNIPTTKISRKSPHGSGGSSAGGLAYASNQGSTNTTGAKYGSLDPGRTTDFTSTTTHNTIPTTQTTVPGTGQGHGTFSADDGHTTLGRNNPLLSGAPPKQ